MRRPSNDSRAQVSLSISEHYNADDTIDELSSENCVDIDELLPPSPRDENIALDAVITKIGMGKFQRRLLVLCGFGWLADNMWLQCIAAILPRVQRHFDVPNTLIGTLSSSIFTGMMFGALFWGVLSDSRGRKIAYKWTLIIACTFGMGASFAPNFWWLCFMLFLLGFGVGGNMPVDGALFLEFVPKENQYLLTFMSVFFSFGAVLSSFIAWIILPYYSCPEEDSCDPESQNNGWRYVLFTLGVLTFLMVTARLSLFRLQESPKFLMSNNRKNDAVMVLRSIVKINGSDVYIDPNDLPSTVNNNDYSSVQRSSDDEAEELSEHEEIRPRSPRRRPPKPTHLTSRISSRFVCFDLNAIRPLFSPKWCKTTLLVFAIWILISLGYTMFNVFLPKYLEKLGFGEPPSPDQVYRDYLIYSLAGVPGSIFGSWLIETPLGRKGTMALSSFGSAFGLFLFSTVQSRGTMVFSSAMVSFLATLLYAVIYAYTPEVFETKLRGTASGISSALGRVAGIAAPITTGILLSWGIIFPLYLSTLLFCLAGVCMVLLPIETRMRPSK
ncbi:uncharacterized protein VTP21DRAFT_10059 [Calcarisporiella thermophila]|uniref:uncharacterized protein n=1 Tax=Calcarisporiella thermophila TaxID=911321 RepID=UPI003742D448